MSWLDTARASLLVLAPLAFSSSVYSPGVFSMQPSHYSCSSAAELAAQCLRQHLVVHRCLANPYPRTTCRCRCCSRLFSSADSQGCTHRQAEATIAATARCSIARDFPLLCLAAEAALYSGEHGGNRWRADGLGPTARSSAV